MPVLNDPIVFRAMNIDIGVYAMALPARRVSQTTFSDYRRYAYRYDMRALPPRLIMILITLFAARTMPPMSD